MLFSKKVLSLVATGIVASYAHDESEMPMFATNITFDRESSNVNDVGSASLSLHALTDIYSGQKISITIPGDYSFPTTCTSTTILPDAHTHEDTANVHFEGNIATFTLTNSKNPAIDVIASSDTLATITCQKVKNASKPHPMISDAPAILSPTDIAEIQEPIGLSTVFIPELRIGVHNGNSSTSTHQVGRSAKTKLRSNFGNNVVIKGDVFNIYYPAIYTLYKSNIRIWAINGSGKMTSVAHQHDFPVVTQPTTNLEGLDSSSIMHRVPITVSSNAPNDTVSYEVVIENVRNPEFATFGLHAYADVSNSQLDLLARSKFRLSNVRKSSISTEDTELTITRNTQRNTFGINFEFDRYRHTINGIVPGQLVLTIPREISHNAGVQCTLKQGSRKLDGRTMIEMNPLTGLTEVIFRPTGFFTILFGYYFKNTYLTCEGFDYPQSPILDGVIKFDHQFPNSKIIVASEIFELPFIGGAEQNSCNWCSDCVNKQTNYCI